VSGGNGRDRIARPLDESVEPVVTLRLSVFDTLTIYGLLWAHVERDNARVLAAVHRNEETHPMEPIVSATTSRALARVTDAMGAELLRYKDLYRQKMAEPEESDS